MAAHPGPYPNNLAGTQKFVALDLALRTAVFVAVSVGFICIYVFLHYSYNTPYFCLGDQPYNDFVRTIMFTWICIIVELVNVFLIYLVCFRRFVDAEMLSKLRVLFDSPRFRLFAVFKFGGVLATALSSKVNLNLIV